MERLSRYFLLAFLIIAAIWIRYDPIIQDNLLEVDGYYWKSLGEQSLPIQLGVLPNFLRLAPNGTREAFNLHTILTSHLSISGLHIYEGFLVILLGIVTYQIGGILLTGMILFSPIIIARTAIGWNDTDIYITLLSLLIAYSLYKNKYLAAGIYISILACFWQGWLLFVGLSIFHWYFSESKIRSLVWLFAGSAIAFICEFDQIRALFTLLPTLTKTNGTWPSGLLTTAELQWSGWPKMIFLTGLASIGIIFFSVLKALWDKKLFLPLLFLATLAAILKGERFLLLFFPIVAFFAVMEIRKSRPTSFLAILYLFISMLPSQTLHRYLMIVDTGWKAAGNYIQTLPTDAVIVSWWSPGHMIVDLGKRAVITDGGSQHLKRTFWIARALNSVQPGELRLIFTYLANFGDTEINMMVDHNNSWPQILAFMQYQLNTHSTRPVHLLLYKEMLLNYPSIRQMSDWFVEKYPSTRTQSLESTCYFRLLTGQFDNILPPQYTYNDGKNAIKLWRLN
jgi:hypothetical protein